MACGVADYPIAGRFMFTDPQRVTQANMAGVLTVGQFISVHGTAGSEGRWDTFGDQGLEQSITVESTAGQVVACDGRTHEALAGLVDDASEESWGRLSQLDKGCVLQNP